MSDSDIPKPPDAEEKPKCRPWNKWRCFRWTARILGLIIVGILAAGYFGRGWLTDRAGFYIDERLRKKGIHFAHGDISYQLERGVVLEDLVLFKTEAKLEPVLKVSNLGFDVGLESLLTGDEVDVKTARLSIEDGYAEVFAGEKVAEVTELQFFGVSERDRVEITVSKGMVNGLDCRVAGEVWKKPKKPETDAVDGTGEEKKPRKALNFTWAGVVSSLIEIESTDQAPKLQLEIEIDLREDAEEKIRVSGNVSGADFRWKGLPLDEANGDFVLTDADKMVDVRQVELVYRGRPISGKMRYDLNTKVLDLERLRSEADLISFLGEQPINLGEKLKGFRFTETPHLAFKGQVPVKDSKSSTVEATCESEGTLVIGQSEKTLSIRLIEGKMHYQGGTVNSEKFSIGMFGGLANVAGAVNFVQKPITYEAGIAFAGMPLQTIKAAFGKESKWAGVVSGSFAGVGGFSFESIEGTGEFNLEGDDFKINGPISLKEAVVASNGLEANFGGGLLSASGMVDTAASPMVFETNAGFEAVSMQSLLTFIGSEKKMEGALSGSFKGAGSNSLVSMAGSGEIRYDSGNYQVEGPFVLDAGVLESENLAVALGGGRIGIQGKTNVVATPKVFEGKVQVDQVPVQSLIDLSGSEQKVNGVLSGSFEGSASNSLTSVAGIGAILFDAGNYQVEGPFSLNAGVAESENMGVALGGGRIGLQGKSNLAATPRVFEGLVQAEKVPVQSLIDLTGSEREVEGNLYGQFQGTVSNTLAGIRGAGAIRVEDGKLYKVPIIGQMRSFLAGALPTFGKVEQSDLVATFTIDQGILNTQDLVAASDMTRVEINGELNLVEQTANFSAQAKVDGVVGVATNVVSGILEVEASGPVSDLDIHLKKGAAGMAAGAVKGTVDVAKTGVGELTERAKNVGGTAVRAGTKGVKTVGKGLGKLIPGFKKKEEPVQEPTPAEPPPVEPVP